jgi:glycosyltransferase involved in cell wall biosynthesis
MNKSGILLVGNFLSSHTGTRSVGEELSLRLSAIGWKTIETSHQPGRTFRLVDMLSSVIVHRKKYQIAYVEVYSGLAFFWAEMVVQLLSLLHKPVVLTLHGGGLVEFAQRNPTRITKLLRKGQIIVTPSLFLQAALKPYNTTIRYLPNAVDVSHYEFQLRYHPAPKIIWLRAFHEIYQPEMAVKVLSFLVKEFKEITLTMIGPDKKDGSLNSALDLAQRTDMTSHINIVGSIPKSEVPIWLAKGDIFLNTTRFESFGVSVVEAALIGLPIVTTSVGELSYLWENEKTAMLVPQNAPEAMANAIRRILTEPGLAERLSSNARRKAEQFDWSVILPHWERLLNEALKA